MGHETSPLVLPWSPAPVTPSDTHVTVHINCIPKARPVRASLSFEGAFVWMWLFDRLVYSLVVTCKHESRSLEAAAAAGSCVGAVAPAVWCLGAVAAGGASQQRPLHAGPVLHEAPVLYYSTAQDSSTGKQQGCTRPSRAHTRALLLSRCRVARDASMAGSAHSYQAGRSSPAVIEPTRQNCSHFFVCAPKTSVVVAGDQEV